VKRSEYIILGAAGLIIVAAFWPKTEKPGDNGEPLVFATPQDCKSAGAFTAEECEAQWGKAAQEQLSAAPKFKDNAACETAHGAGQCRSVTWNAATVFVPAMAGYMLARQFSGGPPVGQPLYPSRQPCPPGVNAPDCTPTSSSSSGSGSSSSSSRSSGGSSGFSSSSSSRSYTTGAGQVVVPFAGSGGRVSSPSSSSSSSYSSSGTTTRAGFGSTSSSYSSSGS
jgi:uncharacterized protein YgiB involved in biofilm formation